MLRGVERLTRSLYMSQLGSAEIAAEMQRQTDFPDLPLENFGRERVAGVDSSHPNIFRRQRPVRLIWNALMIGPAHRLVLLSACDAMQSCAWVVCTQA